MNARRVAALLRALADEIDDTPIEPRLERHAPPVPGAENVDKVARQRARQALRDAGLIGSGAKRRRPRHERTT